MKFHYTLFLCLLVAVPIFAHAQGNREVIEEIVVTGSHISGTLEKAALPVEVIDAIDLEERGVPHINEIIRSITATQGLIGERNNLDTRGGQFNEGVTTINLRGLGSARTLTLINGQRHVATDSWGVDVSVIPMNYISRVEVLKDGAAAVYGSDAIGGVVNFITRDDFEGFEVRGDYQQIEDSDGDWNVGAIGGWSNERLHASAAFEYGRRGELLARERDWGLRPFAENPDGNYSILGNPGNFINLSPFGIHADPNCENLGNQKAGAFCRFPLNFFFNLLDNTETIKSMGSVEYEWDRHTIKLEAAYSQVDIPDANTSPSYPFSSEVLPAYYVFPDHPGRIAFFQENPDFAGKFNPALPLVFWGRLAGVAGAPSGNGAPGKGQRHTGQFRLGVSMKGTLVDTTLDYNLGVNYSKRKRDISLNGSITEKYALALRGLGGPECDPATGTPGVGACEYFNPFSNAVEYSVLTGQANPNFNPAFANSPELLEWIIENGTSYLTNELLVAELILSGDTGFALPGGEVGYAAGGQLRRDYYKLNSSDNYNLDLNPCPYNNPVSVTLGITNSLDCTGREVGPFGLLTGVEPVDLDRTVYNVFAELALPVTDSLDVQAALRYEEYGSLGGSTVDPKIAFKWQTADWIALRGSLSTTFRGPPLSFIQGGATSYSYVRALRGFRRVVVVGNPGLDPETALSSNVGILVNAGGLTASLDYWRFDFDKPFQTEDPTQITQAYNTNGCADGGSGVGTNACETLRKQIYPLGSAGSDILYISRQVINGADIRTEGLDFSARYERNLNSLNLSVGVKGTYLMNYKSEDFRNVGGVTLAPGGNFVGYINEGTPFQPLLDLKGYLFSRLEKGPHTLTYRANYTSGYDDVSPAAAELADIRSHLTHDITYNLDLFAGSTRILASVYNLTDRNPPLASTGQNYDAYTHNPFGRMVKIGIIYSF